MKFPYTILPPLSPAGKWRGMPFVEVTLFGPHEQRTVLGLVDSGAEACILNIKYAEKLKIDLTGRQGVDVYGVVGATQRVPFAPVGIQVKGLNQRIEVTAGFLESDSVGVILGQEGFFDHHRIKFEKDHSAFEIAPVKKK